MNLLLVEGSEGLYPMYNGVKYIPKEDSGIKKGSVRVLTKEEKDGCVVVTGKNI